MDRILTSQVRSSTTLTTDDWLSRVDSERVPERESISLCEDGYSTVETLVDYYNDTSTSGPEN